MGYNHDNSHLSSALVCISSLQVTMESWWNGSLYFSKTLLNSLLSSQVAPSAIITALLEVCNT